VLFHQPGQQCRRCNSRDRYFHASAIASADLPHNSPYGFVTIELRRFRWSVVTTVSRIIDLAEHFRAGGSEFIG